MRRSARRTAGAVVALLLLVAGAVLGHATSETSAAWQDGVALTGTVRSASWGQSTTSGLRCDAYDTSTGALLPAGTCWVDVGVKSDVASVGGPAAFSRQLVVKTSSSTPVTWVVNLALSDTSVFPYVPVYVLDDGTGQIQRAGAACRSDAVARASGATSANRTVASASPRTFTLFGTNGTGWTGTRVKVRDCGTMAGSDAVFPGTSSSTVTQLTWDVISNVQTCVDVQVSTTSYEPVQWYAQIDMTALPFRGDTVMSHYVVEGDNGWMERLDNTPSAGLIQFSAKQSTTDPRRRLSTNAASGFPSSTSFRLCNRNLPAPPYIPSMGYSQTVSYANDKWNACADVSVGVANGSPFYYGWRADVDLGPLVTLRTSNGLSADTVSLRTSGTSLSLLSGTVYRIVASSSDQWGVRAAGPGVAAVSRTMTVCVS